MPLLLSILKAGCDTNYHTLTKGKLSTMKIKLLIGCLFFLFSICNQTNAQKSYWDKAEEKYNSDYRQRIVDNMNSKSGKAPTVPGSSGNTPEFMKTKEQKAADAVYLAEVRQREYAAAQREQDRIRDHQLYLQRIASEKAEQKRIYITNTYNAVRVNKNYTDLEIKVFTQDQFYATYSDFKTVNPPDYVGAAEYIRKLKAAVPETPLDTLIDYVWKTRLFTDFSTNNIQELQRRFPKSKERLEAFEFYILAYYFGASTKYATTAVGYTYPLCSFEMMDDEQKIKVLNRFEELETAYPDIALKVAAGCRVGFNMFYKYATSNLNLKNKTSAKRLGYLYNTLATEQANLILPQGGFDDATWKLLADQLLRGAGNELKLIYPGFVEDLSAEQWLAIAKASKLSVNYIAWAFRDGNDDKNYLKKLPNLTNALKEEYKKADDGEGEITFKNRDRYTGAIKDGKPNGKGKYTSITGDTYEGSFVDGYLHGKGKTYQAKNFIEKGGRISSWEGDAYEGDFKDGKRHGKGTLTNKNRFNYTYIGDWKNGEKDGYGEETFTDRGVTTTYKGPYKNDFKNGFGELKSSNGYSYTGNFKDGAYHGKGVVKNVDGSTLDGTWDEGYLDGKAILTSAKGYVKRYVSDIEKSKHKGKVYSRSITEKDIKYYNPGGKEILEAEYKANK